MLSKADILALKLDSWIWLNIVGEKSSYWQVGLSDDDNQLLVYLGDREKRLDLDEYKVTWVAYKNQEHYECNGDVITTPVKLGSDVWVVALTHNDDYKFCYRPRKACFHIGFLDRWGETVFKTRKEALDKADELNKSSKWGTDK